MRIAYITLYYLPDFVSEGPITEGLVKGLAERGHDVTVIAAVPHNAWGRIHQDYRRRLIWRSTEWGARVFRIWVWASARSNLKGRLLSYGSFMILGVLLGLFTGPYDVVIFYGPPVTNGTVALITALRGRSRLIYIEAGLEVGCRPIFLFSSIGCEELPKLRAGKHRRVPVLNGLEGAVDFLLAKGGVEAMSFHQRDKMDLIDRLQH